MNEIKTLHEAAQNLNYPETMIPIVATFNGLGFFPIGNGTWNMDTRISNKPVMILGQDFDCETNYKKAAVLGAEDPGKNATWRNLLAFLKEASIKPEDCFFTNAIMGIREGSVGTGKSPAFKDKAFIEECREFFKLQIETQKPKLVLVLGKYVGEFLSKTHSALAVWSRIPDFKTIDDANNAVLYADFGFGYPVKFVLLSHPSFRNSNVGRRKYNHLTGHAAEIEMIVGIEPGRGIANQE